MNSLQQSPFVYSGCFIHRIRCLLLGLISLFVLVSCARYQYAEPGLYPKFIRGTIQSDDQDNLGADLVIVIENNRSFIEFKQNGAVYYSTVKAMSGFSNGDYYYNWGSATQSVQVYFFRAGCFPYQQSFSAGLGIGGFEFNPTMTSDQKWENAYRFSIKPLLTNFIGKGAGEISDIERGLISDWMAQAEEFIAQKAAEPIGNEIPSENQP